MIKSSRTALLLLLGSSQLLLYSGFTLYSNRLFLKTDGKLWLKNRNLQSIEQRLLLYSTASDISVEESFEQDKSSNCDEIDENISEVDDDGKGDGSGFKSDEFREKVQSYFTFPLDKWQLDAGEELFRGNSCICCAPTGAGKTVVGEIALNLAFEQGKNAIYTTPLKALSNQKFFELRKIFGAENVGLTTGDTSVNRGARITVMTTEVYRNMAWRSSAATGIPQNEYDDKIENESKEFDDLSRNAFVVLDGKTCYPSLATIF